MRLSKKENPRDGRIVIFLMIATALIVFYSGFLKTQSYNPKATTATFSNICVDELPWSLNQNTLSCFEVAGSKAQIPKNLRPMFFLPVQINTASKALLITIKGIGPSLADKIIAHRIDIGPFKTKYDFMELKGVGIKRAEHLLPFLVFDEVTWATN